MESPDIVALLAREDTPTPPIEETTFFLGNEVILPEGSTDLPRWRASLFAYLFHGGGWTPDTDLFTLGTTAYLLLTGELPHPASTPLEYVSRVSRRRPVALRTQAPGTPAVLADLVMRMLARGSLSRRERGSAGSFSGCMVCFFQGRLHQGERGRSW